MNLLSGIVILFTIWSFQFISTLSASSIDAKISGGEKADPNTYPYIVSLQGRQKWKRYRICGGSIVSQRWIVTAGHCITDYWSYSLPLDAIVGAYSLEYINSDQIYPIADRIAHPYYKGGVGPHDIAVLRTARDIQYSDRVQPIQLPIVASVFMRDDPLTIAGWGALKANRFVIVRPNKLRDAEVSYLPFYDCYKAVNRFKDYHDRNPLVKYSNFCTGPLYEGVAGCSGDSGGPLIRYRVNGVIPTPVPETTTTMEPTIPEITLPEITLPDITLPEITLPDLTTPEITLPDLLTTPEITLPDLLTTPEITLPDLLTTPEITLPDLTSPELTIPDLTTPALTIPDITIPELMTTPEMTASDMMDMTTTDMTTNARFKSAINYDYDSYNEISSQQNVMNAFLVGVISWGVVPCGIHGAPTVYTNVSNHLDFIYAYVNSTTLYK